MNSMPQQAVAKGKGHSEFLRAQPTIVSRVVTRKSVPAPAAEEAGGREGSAFFLPKRAIASRFYFKWTRRRRTPLAEIDRVGQGLHVLHPIQKHQAVQVIDLVLEDAGMIAGGLELHALAGPVDRLDPHRGEPRHTAAQEKGNREAPLRIHFGLLPDSLVGRVEQ